MTGTEDATEGASRLFEEHRDFLWGYCYRLTGCAADADDLVQDTFLRVLEKPPGDTSRPWRPWLAAVASNRARDLYRRRRRRDYRGPWLPSPVPSDDARRPLFAGLPEDGAARVERRESASAAFLLALEVLQPRQREVLLLRDVYDFTTRETAESLAISEANVKTTLHRARKELGESEGRRSVLDGRLGSAHRRALEGLLAALGAGDVAALRSLLAEDVRVLSDSNAEFYAALKPIVGRERVTLALSKIAPPADQLAWRIESMNGLPALVASRAETPPGWPPAWVLSLELDGDGRIAEMRSVVAPRKLTAVHLPVSRETLR